MSQETGFGYKGDVNENGEARTYDLNDGEWITLFCIVYLVATQGGAASVYTSRDRHALCISVKAGKQRSAYWIGPDDEPNDVFRRVIVEWGIRGIVDPLDETIE